MFYKYDEIHVRKAYKMEGNVKYISKNKTRDFWNFCGIFKVLSNLLGDDCNPYGSTSSIDNYYAALRASTRNLSCMFTISDCPREETRIFTLLVLTFRQVMTVKKVNGWYLMRMVLCGPPRKA